MNTTITLGPDVLDKIFSIAVFRQEQKRGRGQLNQKVDSRDDLQIELEGLKGEFAAATLYDVRFNDALEADLGWDLRIYGYRVDVKATRYANGVLLFPDLKHFQADCAFLAIINGDTVRLAGWISQSEYAACHEYRKPRAFLPGERRTWTGCGVNQRQLYRMESFTPDCMDIYR